MGDTRDFPAAHSMDSGWFAIDNDGVLAHFNTGEAGALMTASPYRTGESETKESHVLYQDYIAPWLAEHVPADEFAVDFPGLLVYFDTGEAARLFARQCDAVDLLATYPEVLVILSDSQALRDQLRDAPGFRGLAPGSLYEFMYEFECSAAPLSLYQHGDWSTPGHYIRTQGAAQGADLGLQGVLPRLNTVFEQAHDVQLADVADEYDFVCWGDGDLSGYPPPPPPRTPREGLWSRLANLIKKKQS